VIIAHGGTLLVCALTQATLERSPRNAVQLRFGGENRRVDWGAVVIRIAWRAARSPLLRRERAGVQQYVIADAARARHSVYRAQPGASYADLHITRELSR
jgi:hypothetical protein